MCSYWGDVIITWILHCIFTSWMWHRTTGAEERGETKELQADDLIFVFNHVPRSRKHPGQAQVTRDDLCSASWPAGPTGHSALLRHCAAVSCFGSKHKSSNDTLLNFLNGVTTKCGEETHTFLSCRELPEIGHANVTWQNTIPPFRSSRETPPVGRSCSAPLTCFQST